MLTSDKGMLQVNLIKLKFLLLCEYIKAPQTPQTSHQIQLRKDYHTRQSQNLYTIILSIYHDDHELTDVSPLCITMSFFLSKCTLS